MNISLNDISTSSVSFPFNAEMPHYYQIRTIGGCGGTQLFQANGKFAWEPLEVNLTDDNRCGFSANQIPNATYQWFFNEQPISGATTNMIVADSNGYYSLMVTLTDSCGNEHTAVATKECINLGMEETAATDFIIYPNPSSESVKIVIANSSEPWQSISITDALGKIIWQHTNSGVTTTTSFSFEPPKPGMYVVTVHQKNMAFHRKLIITSQ
jgi:hypothetical protein